MPCNLVGVRTAKVGDRQIAQMLATRRLEAVLLAYAEAKMKEIGSQLPLDRGEVAVELRESSEQQIIIRLGGFYGIDVTVTRAEDGYKVTISHSKMAQQQFDAAIIEDISGIIKLIGVAQLKENVTQFVQANFGIEEQYQKADGTLVIDFTC